MRSSGKLLAVVNWQAVEADAKVLRRHCWMYRFGITHATLSTHREWLLSAVQPLMVVLFHNTHTHTNQPHLRQLLLQQ